MAISKDVRSLKARMQSQISNLQSKHEQDVAARAFEVRKTKLVFQLRNMQAQAVRIKKMITKRQAEFAAIERNQKVRHSESRTNPGGKHV